MENPVRYEAHGDIGVIRVDNPPVNATSHAVREGLVACAREFAASPQKVAVIVGEGRTFIAGADITEFGKAPREPHLPDAINVIEALDKPVVCVIHGTALGGGFEVALGSHYRVMLRGARIGLPEVNLGLLPGAGGTQRLPRLIGIVPAAEIFTSAKMISAEDCLALGIADDLSNDDPFEAGMAMARKVLAEGLPVRRVSEMSVPPTDEAALEALKKKVARANRGHVCHLKAIEVAVEGTKLPFTEGMKLERAAFWEMMQTPQRAAMIHAFFAERKVASLPEIKGVEPRDLSKIGIIGGGTMGGGIAVSCLLSGLSVTLIERDAESVEKAHNGIARTLADSVKRGKLGAEARDMLLSERLLVTDSYGKLSDADLVIEAVFESMEVKKDVFTKLDAVCKPGAVLASNTSYLDVDEIAAMTKRPEDVIGLHFFSPANVMKLLEIVRAKHTADDVVATSMDLAAKINKIAVLVGVCPGFVGNRILFARQKQANKLLQQGLMPWDVDAALNAFGFKMGPFQMSDLAGLDIGWSKGAKTENPIRDALCEMDRRGQKTQAGFYDYDESRRPIPSDVVAGVIKDITGAEANQMSQEEIIEICIYPMINEAVKILEENKAQRPSDIDVVWLNGYGWPADKGGPMFYGDMVGAQAVLDVMEKLGAEDPEFAPAELLRDLAKNGGKFTEIDTGGLKV